jgi:hypothetical protein
MRTLCAALWITLASLACHHRPQGDTPAPGPAPDPNTPVLVEIESHFQGDVVIYLMRGNQRERLGMVSGLSGGAFTFPYRRLGNTGSARLLAYPIAGASAYASDPLYIQPGQSLKWTLEADLSRSSLVSY